MSFFYLISGSSVADVGQVDDWEAAVWIASLVNAELARLRRGRRP